ncbi:DUF4403 family protein [Flavobacterium columnare]|uniref:DUF4403 family protein n=2 Tax=Flavobacterium TaxID=237 RepID=A0A2N9P6Y0_9FLAO|nr:DUF4403 family protein [Flavobacterium columnare]RVU91280.1 DUF4403 family protein [Flavobacterium columnare]SPE76110.1 hypothetical protein FLACOL_00088 [Flavobacterium columnare]
MKKLTYYFFTIIISLLLSNCSSTQKIELMQPEPDKALPVNFPTYSSYLNFPIQLTVKDIENQTNKALTGLIYEDNNLEDDKIMIKIWKNTPITMNEKDQKLQTMVPLKIWAKVKYGTSVLGMDLYDTREFNLNATVSLLSNVNLINWQVNTQTELQNIEWNESPTVSIAGKDIKITYLINPTLKYFKSKIEKSLDDAIGKSLDFKKQIYDLMQKASEPIEMNKNYETWLRINPQEIHSTQIVLNDNKIHLNIGLKCQIESLVGQKPQNLFDKNKLILKTTQQLPNKITASLVALSTYNDASRLINNNFKGKEFSSGNRKISIQNVSIWHKQGKMIIALDLLGSLNGRIYLSGFPKYDTEKKEFYFDDLDYALETKSKLIKTANWLFQSAIIQKLKANCRYSIASNLEEGKKSIMQYLNNYSPLQGIYINGKLTHIDFDKVQLTNESILGFLTITGNLKVEVNGLQ